MYITFSTIGAAEIVFFLMLVLLSLLVPALAIGMLLKKERLKKEQLALTQQRDEWASEALL